MAARDNQAKHKRQSGIPTGNAGEYFVMGELLRRGFDAQLADRNTKGYDILVGHTHQAALQKVQVKSVRLAPWYVRTADFIGDQRARQTIYVLIGTLDCKKPVRYFITRNSDLKTHLHHPKGWKDAAFMPLKAVEQYEDRWDLLAKPLTRART